MTKIPKHIYRTARAVLFAAILAVVGLYLLVYVLVAMPAVQKRVVAIAERELASLLGSDVEIGGVEIFPFNEVRISDIKVYEPASSRGRLKSGDRSIKEAAPCVTIGTVGAGIDLFELIQGRIVITYAEITSLNARITKKNPDSQYNVQFIFDAFKPKQKKESQNVELRIHTVVIRRLAASYDLLWKPERNDGRFDPAHVKVTNFRADISIPKLDTKPFGIVANVRRIAFSLDERLKIKDLSFSGELGDDRASIKDFVLKLPNSELTLSDLKLEYDSLPDLVNSLRRKTYPLSLKGSVTPSDLALFVPELKNFSDPWDLSADTWTDLDNLNDLTLHIHNEELGFLLDAKGNIRSLLKPREIAGDIRLIRLAVAPELSATLRKFQPRLKPGLEKLMTAVGNPSFDMSGRIGRKTAGADWVIKVDGSLTTAVGSVDLEANASFSKNNRISASGVVTTERIELGKLLANADLGSAGLDIDFDLESKGKSLDGNISGLVEYLQTTSGRIENVNLDLAKLGDNVSLSLIADSQPLAFTLDASAILDGPESTLLMNSVVDRLPASLLGLKGDFAGARLEGAVDLILTGNKADNLVGSFCGSDLALNLKNGKRLKLERLYVHSDLSSTGDRDLDIESDICDLSTSGKFDFTRLPGQLKRLFSGLMPSINPLASGHSLAERLKIPGRDEGEIDLRLTLKETGSWGDFFNLPFRPLTEATLSAYADFEEGTARFSFDAPYIRQGKNRLLADTRLYAIQNSPGHMNLQFSTITPTKTGQNEISARIGIEGDVATVNTIFNPDGDAPFSGNFGLTAKAMSFPDKEILVNLLSSNFRINDAEWLVKDGDIIYIDKRISANNIEISHGDQFVKINGTASADPDDKLAVDLADIDLSYVFDVLNINHVNFGGRVTGKAVSSELFTKNPKARTEGLKARNFEYGGALLGDADLRGEFIATEKKIGLGAHIYDPVTLRTRADAQGGIWLGRDSLNFDFDADHINASFLGQFMAAFASDVSATASGKCKLFGTFKDIDLRGNVHADSIRFKLDFTGVYYSGSDSVFLESGRIRIPNFRIYDREGNSGVFSGELRHKFLRDVFFEFRLREAHRLLCYDLPKGPEDIWWGTVYASGNASVNGVPGLVDIDVDVTSDPGSSFFFEVSDKEQALEYNFLTFTDRTPQPALSHKKDKTDIMEMFRMKKILEEGAPTDVHMDLKLNATPGILVSLVTDPVSGDKITARGSGPLQLQYETENDEVRMYGKYTITEGTYNFSLQDVILRDFRIREGSTISFNGDPMAANLDIRAAYRVNTSLTDLDKSFAYDRDLNRTNVPVDAMLLVKGPMMTPEIDFDLEFPTMTEEVARKVRSIVSTDDLMSRQIIYLLALNRFYTPEYMDASSTTGSELTSVASSTLTSQIGNALSQLSDKLSVMPSIRSDKGDFSDLEMDVALSSRLLNNRLLINGNFGYRDRTTSTTTFVGDFDVQYLLDRRGNFRLKAYNHFNDQNYYLRQALTTQGIGLEYRHDFNRFLSFLRRHRKPESRDTVSTGDSGNPEDARESANSGTH